MLDIDSDHDDAFDSIDQEFLEKIVARMVDLDWKRLS